MSNPDLGPFIILGIWVAWSLANLSARLKRTADALDRLVALAERGRR